MFMVSTGLVCSVGLGAPAACAALRAGIAGFEELPFLTDRGAPVIGAAVPDLDPRLTRTERLVEMLRQAMIDCLGASPALAVGQVPLLVGLAEPERPGAEADRAPAVIEGVQARLGWKFHPRHSQAIPQGHTAGFAALRIARNRLQDPDTPACLVCGVDSYLSAVTLEWLEKHWRLKTEEHSNGLIPGEAAAAVLLARAPADTAAVGVGIAGLGFGQEKASILSEEPLLGLGLAEAVRTALVEAGLQMHEIDIRLSDVTGEAYGFKEQALALSRTMRQRRPDFPLWHAADCIGDTGAAAGVVQLVVAHHGFRGAYLPGTRALGCTSNLTGLRAAAVIRGDLRGAGRASPQTMMAPAGQGT